MFDTDLKFIRCFGSWGSGEEVYPCHLAYGNLYVADSDIVQVFSQGDTFLRTFGSERLEAPYGIHVDHGYVYVADSDRNCVLVYTTFGTFITKFGNMGCEEGELKNPCGITTDEDGFVYVCDTDNSRVQVF